MKSQMGYLDVVGKLVRGPNCQRFIFCSLRFGGQTIIRLVAGFAWLSHCSNRISRNRNIKKLNAKRRNKQNKTFLLCAKRENSTWPSMGVRGLLSTAG